MPTRTRSWLIRATVLLVGLGALAGAPRIVAPPKAVHEITLVARGMAFTLEGLETENPEIRVTVGQHVRIRFRNEDPGVDHVLSLPGLNLRSEVVKPGQQAYLELVPKTPGRTSYECTLHSRMMQGTLVILQ
jgi:plastocyanin